MKTTMNTQKTLAVLAAFALIGASAWAVPSSTWGRVDYSDGTLAYLTTTNALGDATLTDADLDPAKTPTNITFVVNNTIVDKIELSGKTLTLTGNGITLTTRGTNSMFNFSGSTGSWIVRGLTFQGMGQTLSEFAPYDGGAIQVNGGSLTLDGCTFTDFVTRFTGGAVSCMRLDGASLITNCTFIGNAAHPINGYGGALYATKSSTADEAALVIVDSHFEGNSAENGGAICTLAMVYDDEQPLAVAIDDGTVFKENVAVFEGGAIIAEGAVSVSGSNTVFRANEACLSGGAICLTGIVGDFTPVKLSVEEATFADNAVGTNSTWAAGGAIAVMMAGCQIDLSKHALFTNNVARTGDGDEPAYGGAVYAAEGVTNTFTKVAFVANRVENTNASTVWCYGGAVSAEPGKTTIDTCVFDCGTACSETCYGDAVDFNEGEVLIKNTTMRRGKVEAVSSYKTAVAITNCVFVGNGLKEGFSDLYLEESPLAMAYTAYGKLSISDTAKATVTNNLSARAAADVYAGDTLKLRGEVFNPVAGLGLKQTATDFDGVAYGSLDYGYAMGAYETNTVRLLVALDGSKTFNTTTSSNGCSWTWALYTNEVSETEAAWTDLGDVAKAFTITNWTFGAASVGSYCSTNEAPNNITAGVEGKTAKIEWLRTVLDFLYTGTISKESEVVVVYDPQEFAWEGTAITPGNGYGSVVVSNTATHTVLGPDEYVLSWDANIDPTASAKLIVTCTNNYNFVETNKFSITAYLTEYYKDDAFVNVTTNGSLSGSNAVAVIDVPTNFCLDYQNAKTNGAVYVFGQGESGEPDVTTLKVLYCTDVVGTTGNVGDGVPDKYQKKVIFATVNGKWDDYQNGYDRVQWVTLTNTTPYTASEGTWSTSGCCTLLEAYVPNVGHTSLARFSSEGDGVWNTNPVGDVVYATTSFPIYFYSPASLDVEDRGTHDKPLSPLTSMRMALAASSSEQSDVEVGELQNALAITDFALDENGDLSGAVKAQVLNSLDGTALAEAMLSKTDIEVWGAETLDGEWFRLCTVTTDAEGGWTVSRMRSARSVSTARASTIDRTAGDTTSLSVSSSGMPQFFKVKMVEK